MAPVLAQSCDIGAQSVLDIEHTKDIVEIDRLQLAAWLQLNGQVLIERRLRDDARIVYSFKRSDGIQELIAKWDAKTSHEVTLAHFSRIVSFEIQTAVRMRRAAGLPTRIRSAETS